MEERSFSPSKMLMNILNELSPQARKLMLAKNNELESQNLPIVRKKQSLLTKPLTDISRKPRCSDELCEIMANASKVGGSEARFMKLDKQYKHLKNTMLQHQFEMRRIITNNAVKHAQESVKAVADNAKIKTKLQQGIVASTMNGELRKHFCQDLVDCYELEASPVKFDSRVRSRTTLRDGKQIVDYEVTGQKYQGAKMRNKIKGEADINAYNEIRGLWEGIQ
ncbi:Hypothetical_protein [Hexamita inflata]|uniref:Hypothetical_protein n=1 Tax=Hexamita inflata TaxID=28002 RepID=A0ABP1HT14_9EUKA